MTYTHETPFTHVYDKFEYYSEDFECIDCANYKSRVNCKRFKKRAEV